MLARLIQSIFFLSICSPLQAMNKKQKDIVHNKLYAKYEIQETAKPYRTIIQPLTDLTFSRSKVKANHIRELQNASQNERALESYNTTMDGFINKLNPICNYNAFSTIGMSQENLNFLEKINFQHCAYAYQLFDFTTTLDSYNILMPLSNQDKNRLVNMREKIHPTAAYLMQSALYLQAINEQQKTTRYKILSGITSEHPEIEAICQLLINYGDSTLSPQDVAKKFIETINNCSNDTKKITQIIEKSCKNSSLSPQDIAKQLKQTVQSQKKSTDLLAAIAEIPMRSKVIQKLNNITLEDNDPLISDFNYILAELYYKDNNYTQADSFYKKNKAAFLKEKKVQHHAFNASINASQSFNKQDIHYLSSLVGNVYNQLKKIDTTHPELSYKVGLLIDALIKNNPKIGILEKTNMLRDALRHFEFTHNNSLHATEQKKAATMCIELHMSLSTIYKDKDDYSTALKHTKNALQYHAHNTPEHTLATILENAEKNSSELYKQHTQLIHNVITFITTKDHVSDIKKNSVPPAEFISSDLCKQLLPYCEQLCQKNKNVDNGIIRLIALNYEHNNNDKACEYIDTFSQPLSNTDLFLKARIYLAKKKQMPDPELESIFKLFVNNKKMSASDQETITSLILTSNTFFNQAERHDLAIKLITQLSNTSPTPPAAIQLAIYITTTPHVTNNPELLAQWQQQLNSCPTFYANIAIPSHYNGKNNLAAGTLFEQNRPFYNNTRMYDYKKIISYFVAAIESKELHPESVLKAQKEVAALYDEWAMTTTDDINTRLALFDKALQYDNHSRLQFKKAMTILDDSDDQDLVNNALQLLENIPQESDMFSIAQIALVHAYCNYSNDSTHIPTLKKLIPLDLNKAIACVQKQINNEQLLQTFVYICIQNADTIDKQEEKNNYLNKALEYINILITNHPNKIDYVSHRMELHAKLHNFKAAIKDIDLMLNSQDISNSRNITKEKLLLQKIEFLLPSDHKDVPYNQIIQCCEQLKSCNQMGIIRFGACNSIHKHTQHIIDNNIFTDQAIEWCCFVANACIAADNAQQLSELSVEQERALADYILSAAKAGNLDAQLIALPYCNAIAYVSSSNITDILRYSRQALLNTNSIKKRDNTSLLINALQVYTTTGVALAYYVLCDYYKKHPQEIEKLMMLFNEAKEQQHPRDDAADLIQEICASCKDTLLTYFIERDIKNQKQSIAFFTLGSMYQYSNTADLLEKGIGYLWAANNDLNYKNSPYEFYIKKFLGISHYKLAVIEEQSGTINYKHLCTSAKIGSLEAAHKLANIYIEQHNNNTQNIPVKTSDFMPSLEKVLDLPSSRELFEKCKEILKSEKNNNPLTYKTNSTNINTLLSNSAEITNNQIINCAINAADFIMQSPHATKLVKYQNYTENNKTFKNAIKYFNKKNGYNKAIALLQQAVKQKKPNVCMLLTLLYTQNATNTEDYHKIEIMLDNALLYGLEENNTTKQFHNKLFLNILINTILTLTTDELPEKNRRHLLSTINNTLTNNNVDMETFYALFKDSIGIDLPSLPEWTGKNTQIDTPVAIISNARQIIVKDINATEAPADLLKALKTSQNGDPIASVKEMQIAATIKKIDSAFLLLSLNYLLGIGVIQDYDIANKYLQEAFTYGLIEKQFRTDNFLSTLYSCISTLIHNESLSSVVKKSFLQTIKKNLTDHNIDMTAFCTVVKENMNIDLLSIYEWTDHSNNNNNNNNNQPSNKIISLEKEQPKSYIYELKRKLVKDPTNSNVSEDFQKACIAVTQKNATESIQLLDLAAEKNDPCTCITVATNYLLGKASYRKTLVLAIASLKEALLHGLIDQQFCNSLFLEKLCKFIEHVISLAYTPDEIKFKKNLLLHIKRSLTKHKINLKDFYDIVSHEVKIQLHTCPEWIEAEKDSQFTEQELKSFLNESLEKKDFTVDELNTELLNRTKKIKSTEVVQQKDIPQLKKQLIKDLTNSTVSEDFKTAMTAIIKKDIVTSYRFLTLASQSNDPCADITLATNHLLEEGKNKESLLISISFLKKSLDNCLIERQFCNGLFLNRLCKFIQHVVSISYMPDKITIKNQLLWLIKDNLLKHGINVTDFSDLVSHEVNIQLDTYPEWKNAEKNSTLTAEELLSSINESFIGQEINTFFKNPNYVESPNIRNAMEILEKGDINGIKKSIELIKDIAEKEKDPQAFCILASEYLRGNVLKKNVQLSEKYLKLTLEYSVSEKQFSNYKALLALGGYIYIIITDHPKNIKQKFFPIIKTFLKEKGINLKLFETIFKDEYKIDLSTIPEWK